MPHNGFFNFEGLHLETLSLAWHWRQFAPGRRVNTPGNGLVGDSVPFQVIEDWQGFSD